MRNSTWWWALIDEICNQRHIMNFPIHKDVTNIFLNNPLLIYLRSTNGENLEIPRVLYHGGSAQSIPFIFVFGPKSSVTGKYGPYYYLGTYKKAVRFAGWTLDYKSYKENNLVIADENGKFIKGGIVRYAVFLGKLKVLLNHPQDVSTGDREFSSKLEDREGLWAKNYDSLYHGRVKINQNSSILWRINPEFITKNFKQQIPLSFHYIDKSSLKVNWDPAYNKYYIE